MYNRKMFIRLATAISLSLFSSRQLQNFIFSFLSFLAIFLGWHDLSNCADLSDFEWLCFLFCHLFLRVFVQIKYFLTISCRVVILIKVLQWYIMTPELQYGKFQCDQIWGNFGNILRVFGSLLKSLFNIWTKVFNDSGNFYDLRQICIVINGQNWTYNLAI